jgi:hypothetical protein
MFVKLKLIFFILIFSFSSLFSFNLLRNFFENKNIFSYKDKKTKDEEEELLKQKVNNAKIAFFLKWFKPQQLSNFFKKENNERLSEDLKSLLPFFNLNYDENHILEKIYHKKVQEDSNSIKYSFFEIWKILNETDEKFNLFLDEDKLIKLLDFSFYLKYLSSFDIIFNDQTLFSNKLIKLNKETKKDSEIILDYYHEKIPWLFLDYFLEIILILISILNSENFSFNISESKSKFLCKNELSKKDFSSIEDFYKEIIDCNFNFIIKEFYKEFYEYISLYDLYLLVISKISNNDNQESHYPEEININKDFWEQFKIYYKLNITLTDSYRKIENFFIDYPYGILTFEWRMIYNKDESLKKIVFNQIIYEEKLKNKEWLEKFKNDHLQLINSNNYQEIEIVFKNNPKKKLNFKIKNIYIDNILSELNITLSNNDELIYKISNESSISIDNPQENLSRAFVEVLSRNIKNIIIYFSFILFNKKIIDFSNINSFIDSLNFIKYFFKSYIFSDFSFSEENNYYSKEDKYNQKLNEMFSIFEEILETVISYFCNFSYLNICYFLPLSLNDEIKMEIIKKLKEQKIEIFKKYFHFFQLFEENFFIIEELLRIFEFNFIKKFFIYFKKFIFFFLKKNYKDLINEALYKDKNFLSIKDIFNFLESEYVLNDNDFFNFIKKYFLDEKFSFFSVIKDNFFFNNKIINEKIKTLKIKLYTYWKFLKQIFSFREIKISYLEKNFNDLIIDFKDENSTKVYRIEASFNKDNYLNDIRMIDNIEN